MIDITTLIWIIIGLFGPRGYQQKRRKEHGSEWVSERMCGKLFDMNRNHINSDQIGMNMYARNTYIWLTFGALYLYVSIFVRTLIIYKSMKIYECLTTAPFRSPSPTPPTRPTPAQTRIGKKCLYNVQYIHHTWLCVDKIYVWFVPTFTKWRAKQRE